MIVYMKWWKMPETNETNENQIAWCKWRKFISFTRQLFHSAVVLPIARIFCSVAVSNVLTLLFRNIGWHPLWLHSSLTWIAVLHMKSIIVFKSSFLSWCVLGVPRIWIFKLIDAFGCHLRHFSKPSIALYLNTLSFWCRHYAKCSILFRFFFHFKWLFSNK